MKDPKKELEKHYKKYPHLRPKHLKEQDALRSNTTSKETRESFSPAFPITASATPNIPDLAFYKDVERHAASLGLIIVRK